MKAEELLYVTEVVRRLKALLLLGGQLDDNYRKAAKSPLITAKAAPSKPAAHPGQ